MSKGINNVLKMIEQMENNSKRMSEFLHNKKIGYEPKCKVCNSKYQDIIERSREEGVTLEDIRDYVKDKGEDISIMSLSRHFDRHYPARKKFLQEIDEKKAQEIEEGEKKIEYIKGHYPEIIQKLEGDMTVDYEYESETDNLKNIKKPAWDVFIFDYGYCFDGDKLCNLVPKAELLMGTEVSDDLEIKLKNLIEERSDYLDRGKFKIIKDLLECVKCQAFYDSCTTEALLKLIIYDKYRISMEKDDFKRIMWEEDFRPEDMDKRLKEYVSKKLKRVKKNLKE